MAVHPHDQEKSVFTTPWGTFMYAKIPFGIMNDGDTFQRAMDLAFVGIKDKFVLIYLDDLTFYSHIHHDHLQHLRKVFLKCRRYGISLNPKKSQFALNEGNILGHIVLNEGVEIDLVRVEAIQRLSIPRSKRDIQSFLGKINFFQKVHSKFLGASKAYNSHAKKGCKDQVDQPGKKFF